MQLLSTIKEHADQVQISMNQYNSVKNLTTKHQQHSYATSSGIGSTHHQIRNDLAGNDGSSAVSWFADDIVAKFITRVKKEKKLSEDRIIDLKQGLDDNRENGHHR